MSSPQIQVRSILPQYGDLFFSLVRIRIQCFLDVGSGTGNLISGQYHGGIVNTASQALEELTPQE